LKYVASPFIHGTASHIAADHFRASVVHQRHSFGSRGTHRFAGLQHCRTVLWYHSA